MSVDNTTPGFTIIVQSTDSFSDCWPPFFELLSRYWPDCRAPILLNTESKSFSHPPLDIRSTNNASCSPNWPTWSESLLHALSLVETDYVLLILEDMLPSAPVDVAALERCLQQMERHKHSAVTLTQHGTRRPTKPSADELLLEVTQSARYRISSCPALWRVEALRSYLRPQENVWEFEILGSRRARKRPDSLFIANPAAVGNDGEGILPYFQGAVDTAIVKGRWQRGIEEFFESRGIVVDFEARGFFTPPPWVFKKLRVLMKLNGLLPPRRWLGRTG